MAYLISPPTYLPVATFKGMANDFDLSSYTDPQLQQKLCAASAWANSIMRRDLLAQEQVIRYVGDGSNKLDLVKQFVLYVKRAQIIISGSPGYSIPPNELLLDFDGGNVYLYAPLYFAGAGYRAMFPAGAPLDLTIGWGFGVTVAQAPAWTQTNYSSGGGLASGSYNIAVTAKTFYGETSALVKQQSVTTGGFQLSVTTGVGVYLYRTYISSATNNTTLGASMLAGATSMTVVGSTVNFTIGSQWLLDTGVGTQEVVTITGAAAGQAVPISAAVNAHNNGVVLIPVPLLAAEMPVSAYGTSTITMAINSLTPQNNLYSDTLPTADTSAPPIPWALQEAVRLLTLSQIFEQNNPANRGVRQEKSGNRMVGFVSTDGNSGRGVPVMALEAEQILQPLVFRGIV